MNSIKKYLGFLMPFLVLIILTACSADSSLELIDANVKIVKDKNLVGSIGITEGERKGEKLIPTALYYEFKIKNSGNKTLGAENIDGGIDIQIVPKDKLKTASKEIMGFNIYNPEEYDESGMGFGETTALILSSNEEAEYTLSYDLGVSEENPNVPNLVPSSEKLEELKNVAFEAVLVVTIANEEIASFDLDKFEN